MKITYVERIRKMLQKEFMFLGAETGLLDVYAMLVLTVGEKCSLENVHDAWSVWQNSLDKQHYSLKPFKELSPEIKKKCDEKYRDVIIKIAKRLQED